MFRVPRVSTTSSRHSGKRRKRLMCWWTTQESLGKETTSIARSSRELSGSTSMGQSIFLTKFFQSWTGMVKLYLWGPWLASSRTWKAKIYSRSGKTPTWPGRNSLRMLMTSPKLSTIILMLTRGTPNGSMGWARWLSTYSPNSLVYPRRWKTSIFKCMLYVQGMWILTWLVTRVTWRLRKDLGLPYSWSTCHSKWILNTKDSSFRRVLCLVWSDCDRSLLRHMYHYWEWM